MQHDKPEAAEEATNEIVRNCLRVDRAAQKAYGKLSDGAKDPDLARFWSQMADEEREHCGFWQKVLAKSSNRDLPRIFEEPHEVLAELEQHARDAEEIAEGPLAGLDAREAFLKGFRMESYLLHPAFEVLFRILGDGESWSPEANYDQHVAGFIEQMRRHGSTPEIELVAELLSRMWDTNRRLASEYDRIRELKRLLPICAACKSIRDDKGYWQKLEKYITDHSDARFTHGICPSCAERLYPHVMSARSR